jgi:hypothetical protein
LSYFKFVIYYCRNWHWCLHSAFRTTLLILAPFNQTSRDILGISTLDSPFDFTDFSAARYGADLDGGLLAGVDIQPGLLSMSAFQKSQNDGE